MTEPARNSATNALTKKIGPLPGYAYVLIAVAVVLGYRWWHARNAGTVPQLSTDPSTQPAAPAVDTGGGGSGTVVTPNGSPGIISNAVWSSQAASGLIAKGGDVTAVTNALVHFLAGAKLSPQEDAIVKQAITAYGNPPEGLLPINSAPASAPGPLAASVHTYKWQVGDTLTSVSEHFFGDPNQGWRILAANPGVAIHRGQGIKIPIPLSANQYAISPGDTWETVSMHFYGNTSHVPALKAANPGVRFQRGQTLRIP